MTDHPLLPPDPGVPPKRPAEPPQRPTVDTPAVERPKAPDVPAPVPPSPPRTDVSPSVRPYGAREAMEAERPAPDAPSARLLARAESARPPEVAAKGWRGAWNALTGARSRPGKYEVGENEVRAELRRPFDRPLTIMVANPKGGVGKTPTTLMLAATLGTVRGGYVCAWDNNETRGTLGLRAQATPAGLAPQTVWDLLSDLERFESADARVGELARYMRSQPTWFDVLASDEDAARMAQIDAAQFDRIHRVLQRFYRFVVIDTGNNLRAPNWQAAAAAADQLVIVTTYDWDTAYSASWMIDHLIATGHESLVERAVTVVTQPGPQRVDAVARGDVIDAFRRTGAIVEIPFDPALRGGGEIGAANLREVTRRAWLEVGAAVCIELASAPAPQPLSEPESAPEIDGPTGPRLVSSLELAATNEELTAPNDEPLAGSA